MSTITTPTPRPEVAAASKKTHPGAKWIATWADVEPGQVYAARLRSLWRWTAVVTLDNGLTASLPLTDVRDEMRVLLLDEGMHEEHLDQALEHIERLLLMVLEEGAQVQVTAVDTEALSLTVGIHAPAGDLSKRMSRHVRIASAYSAVTS